MDEITTEENDLLPKLKPYEIYLFNLWLFFALLIFICLFVVIMPEDFISDYFGIIFPAKYWFIAVPTHILTTLLGLTICIKGFELIYTLDDPPIKDFYYQGTAAVVKLQKGAQGLLIVHELAMPEIGWSVNLLEDAYNEN